MKRTELLVRALLSGRRKRIEQRSELRRQRQSIANHKSEADDLQRKNTALRQQNEELQARIDVEAARNDVLKTQVEMLVVWCDRYQSIAERDIAMFEALKERASHVAITPAEDYSRFP